MEQALATTEAGKKRLEAAEERINTRLAKAVEDSDARPERGIEAAGPDDGFDDLFGDKKIDHRSKMMAPATEIAGERTCINDWIDSDGEDMDVEHGDQALQSPESPGLEYERTEPRGSESEAETHRLARPVEDV